MTRTKAERDRIREDLLLAIDELGQQADTTRLALATDSTHGQVNAELRRMERAGLVRCFLDRSVFLLRWVRSDADDVELDIAEDLVDIARQERTWEPA